MKSEHCMRTEEEIKKVLDNLDALPERPNWDGDNFRFGFLMGKLTALEWVLGQRISGDMVDDLYKELAEKTPELKRLESRFENLTEKKIDSSKYFENFDSKNTCPCHLLLRINANLFGRGSGTVFAFPSPMRGRTIAGFAMDRGFLSCDTAG